jgi:hypothetical protein
MIFIRLLDVVIILETVLMLIIIVRIFILGFMLVYWIQK